MCCTEELTVSGVESFPGELDTLRADNVRLRRLLQLSEEQALEATSDQATLTGTSWRRPLTAGQRHGRILGVAGKAVALTGAESESPRSSASTTTPAASESIGAIRRHDCADDHTGQNPCRLAATPPPAVAEPIAFASVSLQCSNGVL
jgi:hypothetical protein